MSNPNCYHLDTCYLDYLTSRKNNRETHRIAKQVIKNLNFKRTKISISQLAVGEFVKVAARDGYGPDVITDFYDSIRTKQFEIITVERTDTEIFVDLARELRQAEAWIGQTDVLILAHSMVASNCVGLLTFSGDLITNPAIRAIQKKRVTRQFTITSDPFR